MSAITRKDLMSAARLAAIEIDSHEEEFYLKHLNSIMNVLDIVAKAEIQQDVQPLISVTEKEEIVFRKDEITDGNCAEKVLANTKSEFNCFVVPKVIDSGE